VNFCAKLFLNFTNQQGAFIEPILLLRKTTFFMPREFQPLLLRDLDISIEGYRISRLVLNRHTPQVDGVSRHDHENFHQCLVYLKGRGHQIMPDQEIAVRRGSLVFIPQKMRHGFRKKRALRPLCLAIDFESDTAEVDWKISSHLNPSALKRLEQGLVRLAQLSDSGADSLSVAVTILDLVGILRETATSSKVSVTSGPLAVRVRSGIHRLGLDSVSAADISKQLGFREISELNGKLRSENSPTVSQILSSEKLIAAKSALQQTSRPVGEIAEKVGFLDQNYFARWFKTQTGDAPSEFRRN